MNQEKSFFVNDQEVRIELIEREAGRVRFKLGTETYDFRLAEDDLLSDQLTGRQYSYLSTQDEVFISGKRFLFKTAEVEAAKGQGSKGGLLSPMPGKLLKLHVKVGDRVEAGQVLMVLEAMKMEHALKAPTSGVIKALPFQEGDQVKAKVELAELEAGEN